LSAEIPNNLFNFKHSEMNNRYNNNKPSNNNNSNYQNKSNNPQQKPYYNKNNNYNNQNNQNAPNNQNNQNNQNRFQNKFQNNKPQQLKPQVTEIIISPMQVNNPIWSVLKIPFKTDDKLVADFVIPESQISIIFLSLQFHQNYPLYIEDKLDKFDKSEDSERYFNKVMLCLFDTDDINNHLMDLTVICIMKGIKLLVGFSFSEIANYIASFKYIEKYKAGYMKEKFNKSSNQPQFQSAADMVGIGGVQQIDPST